MHGVEAAAHVQRDDLVELVVRRLRAGLADRPGAARDVDQDVDAPAECVLRGLRGALAGGRAGHVAWNDDRLAAASRDLAAPPARSPRCRARSAPACSLRARTPCSPRRPCPSPGPVITATRPFSPKSIELLPGSCWIERSARGLTTARPDTTSVRLHVDQLVRTVRLRRQELAREDLARSPACAAACWRRPGCRSPSSCARRRRRRGRASPISGWFISSLMVASKRSSSTSILISGSRLSTAATEAFGSLIESTIALLIARRKPAHRLRVLLDELLREDERVGIEIHAVVAVVDPAELLVGIDAGQLGREADGVDVAEHAVGLSAHQHLLAQVRLEVGDGDLALRRSWRAWRRPGTASARRHSRRRRASCPRDPSAS